MTWEDIAEAKRETVRKAIPPEWINDSIKHDMTKSGFINTHDYLDTIVPDKEKSITKLTMLELQSQLAKGELKAVEVTKAYCHRTALAQQLLNCCSEIFFEKAVETAEKLDDYFAKHGKVIGPLHGIPISLKDQVDLPGKDSSIGYIALVNQPKDKMSLLAEYLQTAGAIFYVKTTVPMAMMAPETESNIFGYTFNAINNKLSCGGSSGGEGALIGAGASPMGFGTDIGGSIRIPSAFQGLYGLRPTGNRISYLRVTNSYSGQEVIPSVIGPMTRSIADLEYMSKLIFEGNLWHSDPKVLHVPYTDQSDIKKTKLTYGMWKFDGKVMPHPPIQRALEMTKKALIAHGHEVIDIDLPNHDKIVEVGSDILTADQGLEVEETCKLSGEPIVPCVKSIVTPDPSKKPFTINQWWDLANKRYECRQQFLDFCKSTSNITKSGKPIDAIIGPVWPSTSFLPGIPSTLNYSVVINLLDLPSVVVPVTKANKDLDPIVSNYAPINKMDETIYKSYDPELFDGMPACLQVIGRNAEDEKILAIASVVDNCLNG